MRGKKVNFPLTPVKLTVSQVETPDLKPCIIRLGLYKAPSAASLMNCAVSREWGVADI